MSSVPTDDGIEPPSELQTVDLHGRANVDDDRPAQTLMYDGEFFEDLRPLAEQSRLTVRFNDNEYRPSYLSVNERTSRQRVPVDDSVPEEVDGIEADDMVFRMTSVGFDIDVHFPQMLGPYEMGETGMGPRCLGLTILGVHEEWSSHNCQIIDYGLGVNDDGDYELSLQVDQFEREERQ